MPLIREFTSLAPTWRSDVVVAFLKALVLRPAGALINGGAELHLIKDAGFAVRPTITSAALAAVEADYDGYAPVSAIPSEPVNLGEDGKALVSQGSFIITAPTPTAENSIYGYWLAGADDDEWLIAEMFPTGSSCPMAVQGDYLILSGLYPLLFTPPY